MIDFAHSINPLYSLSGFLVGGLVGFTGVGGGSLMTPILVLVFGIAPTAAVGTDLLYAAITKSNGTLVHALNGTIEWSVTRRLALGSIPATILTLSALSFGGRDHLHAVNDVITSTLGVALLLTAASILFRRSILNFIGGRAKGLTESQTRMLTVVLGAFLGLIVSLSSVGAGAIGMTLLLALYPRLPTARLVGSDIAHAVPLTFIAGAGHWMMGSIDWSLLASLLVGSIPGIALGSHFAAKTSDRVLRPLLAATLALVGLKLSM